MSNPLVMLITDGASTDATIDADCARLASLAGAAASAGLAYLQIREKNLSTRALYRLAVAVAAETRGTSTRLLINERADVALAAGADGVHLPSYAMPVNEARRAFPSPFTVGFSAHAINEVTRCAALGVDYVTFSPIFESPGKGAPVGLDRLREAVEAAGAMPVIALGGVDGSNWRECCEIADGFAAIRFLSEIGAMREIVGGIT